MTEPPQPAAEEDHADTLNGSMTGWNKAMGLRFIRATSSEVVVELDVGPSHLQPYGIVHGGVYTGVIETVSSVGAAIYARKKGQAVVGLENHTSFMKAVREGTIRVSARPLTRGRNTQLWEATATDGQGHALATGRVRLFLLDAGASIAGAKVDIAAG